MTNYTWPQGWSAIPNAPSEADAEAYVQLCYHRRSVIYGKLRDLQAAGEKHRLSKLAAQYFDCGAVKVAVLVRAVREKDAGWSAARILAEAKNLNLRKACNEPVFARYHERQNKEPRLVVSFGPKELARQWIALDVLRLRARLHPNQFVCQGGMNAIQVWLRQNLATYTHVLTTDFPCFFPTLNRKLVRETVLLPQTVIEEVLFAPMDKMEVMNPLLCRIPMKEEDLSFDVCGVRPGWGIPPGSALSPLAAECALRPILEAVEERVSGVQVATYADNLIILANSAEQAEASKDALSSAVEDYFHSRVVDELRSRSKITMCADGFEFLGYDFAVIGGNVRHDINLERWLLFRDRIMIEWNDAPLEACEFMRERAASRIAGYEHSHRLAANVKELAEQTRAYFADW